MNDQTDTTIKPSVLTSEVITRAVLYARVSGDDRKYATSGIEGQLKDCRNYAGGKHYQIVGEYFEDPDRQTSGSDWLPELDKVLKLAHLNAFDVLIVREIDRLARNRFKQLAIETDLEALGMRVEYVIGQFEDTVEGRLLKGIMSEFAQFEREKIKERVVRGAIRAIKDKNVHVGQNPPFGYDVENVDGKRKLVVNEGEAAVVQLIFDLYVNQSKSLRKIASYLNEHNIPIPRRNNSYRKRSEINQWTKQPEWSQATVGKILKNETYIGRWHYRKNKRVKDLKTGKVRIVPRPKSEWLMVECDPVVNESIFNAAKKQRSTNRHIKSSNQKRTYFLGGMIRCGECGKAAFGKAHYQRGKKEYTYYACAAAHRPGRYAISCENKRLIRTEVVDEPVWNWIRSILLEPETLDRSLDEYQQKQDDAQDPVVRMIESSENKLAKLEDQHKRLIDAYTVGVLSLDDLAKSKADLDKQIADTRKAIESLQADLDPQTLTKDDIESIHQFAARFRENVDLIDADLPARRELAKLLQVTVVMTKNYITVTCVLGGKELPTLSTTKVC